MMVAGMHLSNVKFVRVKGSKRGVNSHAMARRWLLDGLNAITYLSSIPRRCKGEMPEPASSVGAPDDRQIFRVFHWVREKGFSGNLSKAAVFNNRSHFFGRK